MYHPAQILNFLLSATVMYLIIPFKLEAPSPFPNLPTFVSLKGIAPIISFTIPLAVVYSWSSDSRTRIRHQEVVPEVSSSVHQLMP